MWNFSDLRTHLLPLAKTLVNGIEKIILARELGIQDWLVPAYLNLCQRPEPLTVEEATKLGIHSVLMISRLREEFRPLKSSVSGSDQNDRYCSSCIGFSCYHGHPHLSPPRVKVMASTPFPMINNASTSGNTCVNCGRILDNYFCRNNTSGQNNASMIEKKLEKWVKGGCITE
jgi:hypothetical protein